MCDRRCLLSQGLKLLDQCVSLFLGLLMLLLKGSDGLLMNLLQSSFDLSLLGLLGLENSKLVVERRHLEIDVIVNCPDCLLFFFVFLSLDLTFLCSDRLHFVSSPLVESYFLGKQSDQVLDLVGLLPQLLLLTADILMLRLKNLVRRLALLKKGFLLVDVLNKHCLNLQRVVAIGESLNLGHMVLHG